MVRPDISKLEASISPEQLRRCNEDIKKIDQREVDDIGKTLVGAELQEISGLSSSVPTSQTFTSILPIPGTSRVRTRT